MNNDIKYLDNEELELLQSIHNDEWVDDNLKASDIDSYKNFAKYTKTLNEKKQKQFAFQSAI